MQGGFQITWLDFSIVLPSLPSAMNFSAEISLRQVSREILGDPWSSYLHNGEGSTTEKKSGPSPKEVSEVESGVFHMVPSLYAFLNFYVPQVQKVAASSSFSFPFLC